MSITKLCTLFGGLVMSTSFLIAETLPTPVWDLTSSEISDELKLGTVEIVNGEVALLDGAAFAVPASVIEDPRNFTIEVTASLNELVDHTLFTAMKKQADEDDGFTFAMNYRVEPWYARHIYTIVNNVVMSSQSMGGKSGPQSNKPYTFTLAMRDGFASFYIDGVPYKKCYMEVVANDEPIWIGRNLDESKSTMNAVISDVKVYGADYVYITDKDQGNADARGVIAGKGWALEVPTIEHADWPKVLIYGDSISMGYRNDFIPALLEKEVYVFHCTHFIKNDVPARALKEMAASYKFDVIVFNNGLHSLHWTPDNVPDAEVGKRMSQLTQCFLQGAPQAKIFYLMTTPYTAKPPAPGEPVNALGDKDPTVVRLNTISQGVMDKESIEIIDIYTVLAGKLELAGGDHYHWKRTGYEVISNEIQQAILPALDQTDK